MQAMPTTPTRSGRRTTAALALLTVTLIPGLAQLPALAQDDPAPASKPLTEVLGTLGEDVLALPDLDVRGSVLPSLAQQRAAADLDLSSLRWNDYGTPASLLPRSGVLGRAAFPGDAVRSARAWLEDNAAVFGLTREAMAGLELVSEQQLAEYDGGADPGSAVLLRQRLGGLVPAVGGLVTVGVANGEIAYVSSSLARTTATPPRATLSPLEGWLAAAEEVGRDLPGDVAGKILTEVAGGWTRLVVPGFAQQQQVRLRALALPDGSVRPVLEANVVDSQGGSAMAYTSLVDAVTGEVLVRHNKVHNDMVNDVYSGTFSNTDCGPKHEFELTDDLTRTISAAGLALPVDDMVVKFFGPRDELLYTGDLLTSPELATYTAPEPLRKGTYAVQVCPFDSASAVVGAYAVLLSTSDTATPSPGGSSLPDPTWQYFPANPAFGSIEQGEVPTNDVVGCWSPVEGCTVPTGPFANVGSPFSWDQLNAAGLSTMTTVGNNANTHEAWISPLTPGGLVQAPVSPTRDYTGEFTDAWNESKCDPAQLVPGGNDINYSTANLFVSHNRMHDYSYYLGFTEENYNLQLDNFGHGGVPGDQEVGNAQAGALTSPVVTETGVATGRNNANQITLQDGVPGITNQYLFAPLAGAFYAPCTDGGLDMGIVGHEYTHAISNRMVAGPDEGLTSHQGGAMGESWSDQVAAEYQFSHGYKNGGNIFAVGVYATGNKKTAIRNYAMNRSDLNYSNVGYDTTGPQVHADGEIWSATNWTVRQALVKKWNARFPYADKRLQLQCAQATRLATPLDPARCPGNRRWIQLMFDSFLLQQGATSMLDARDAMLAADRMRFGGADRAVMWKAFAQRGMGVDARTDGGDATSLKGGFASPMERNARVTFQASKGAGKVFVGRYQARTTPVADTSPKSKRDATASFAPGTYRMLYTSGKGGFHRFTLTVGPGEQRTVRLPKVKNLAAKANGAKVIAATEGSLNVDSLIDGDEDTNWAGVTAENVDESRPSVAVDLAGGVATIRRVQVSALLNPVDGTEDVDQSSGSRFTALRRFAIEVCVTACTGDKARWTRVFTSRPDAFPSVRPRPTAPTQTLRSFDIRPSRAAAVRLVTLENQCTGFKGYAGELDNDPTTTTDCATGSDRGTIVHAAELQVYAK